MTKDIVQEVYVNVVKYIDSLKDEKAFVSWLNKITYNITKRELGKLNKIPFVTTDEEINMNLIDENNPLIKCIEDESAKEVIECILNLKEKYRTILILKYFNKYKVKDMAVLLDCPEGTVKSRLNAARIVLKDKLVKKYNKVVIFLGFSRIVSSALTETAEASVLTGNNSIKQGAVQNTLVTSKIILSTIATISILSVGTASAMLMLENNKEKNVQIEYDNRVTNKSVKVSVKIDKLDKNDNVRVVSSNNEEMIIKKITTESFSVIFESNGSYKLIVNDEIISTININNIDVENPIVKEYRIDGKILEVFLSDNLSGIDYDKIEVISEDDKKIDLLSIDKDTNKIAIDLSKGIKKFKIVDNVGNCIWYKISINI